MPTQPKSIQSPSPSTNQFQWLFLNHPLPMWVYDLKTLAFLDVNDAAVEQYGYSRKEFLQLTIKDIHPAEELPRLMEDMKKKRPARQPSGEWKHKCKDGRIIDVEITSRTLEYNGQKAALITAQDITGRKRAEKRYQSLFNQSHDAIFILDLQGRHIQANQRAADMLGYTLEEIQRLSIEDTSAELEQSKQIHKKLINGERVPLFERIFRRKDGSFIHAEVSVELVRDEYGNPLYIQSVVRDITERKRAEEALALSEEKYRTLIEQLPAIVYVDLLDGKGTTLFISPQVETILGISVEEWLKQDISFWLNLIHPEDRSKALNAYTNLTTVGQGYEIEYRVNRPDGSMLWIHDKGIVQQGKNKQLLLQGVIYDITRQKQAEEKLKLHEAALNAAANTIVITDREGLIEWANPSFSMLTGYDTSEVTGKNPRDLVKSGKQDKAFYENLWNTILSGQVWRGELVNRRKDGTFYEEEMTITPLWDAAGKISHFIAIKQDITERKQAERKLRESEKPLREAQLVARLGSYLLDIPSGMWTSSEILDQLFGIGETYERSVQGWVALIHPDDQTMMANYFINEVVGQGKEFDKEYRIVRQNDGAIRWVHGLGKLEFDAGGRPVKMHGTIQDITERKRRERELEAQAILAQSVSEILELNTLLGQVLKAARHAIPNAEKASLALMVDEQNLQVSALSGYQEERVMGYTYPLTWGYAGRAARERTPVLITDIHHDPKLHKDAHDAPIEEIEKIQSAIAVPLLVHETLIGVLSLESTRPNVFQQDDMHALVNLAIPTALIIERTRLFEASRQKTATILAINALGRALASTLDLSTIYRHAIEHLRPLLKFNNFAISLFDEAAQTLHAAYINSDGQELDVKSIPPLHIHPDSPHQGRAGAILDGQIMVVNNLTKNPQHRILVGDGQQPQSAVYTPMWVEGKIIGLLELQSYENHAYRPEDFDLLNMIANQIGLAIENANLFEKTRKHAEENAALLQTSLALTNLNLDIILQTIGERASALFEADACRIFLTEEADPTTLRCVLALGENEDALLNLKIKFGEGVTGSVAAQGQAEIVNDMKNDPRAVQVNGTPEEDEVIMFAPLKSGARVIGVMSVKRLNLDKPFLPSDLELLKAFASLAASAVSNARLFETTRQRVQELEMLYESGMSLNRLLTPKEIGQKIVELMGQKMNWHHTTVRLYNPQNETFTVLAFNQPGLTSERKRQEVENRFNKLVSRIGEGLSGWAVQHAQVVRSGDVSSDSRYVETYPGLHSGMYVPMKLGERVIGVISIESEKPNAFSEIDERLASTLASQAAIALENARLFDETRQRMIELATVNRISIALRAITKKEEMLAVVLEETLSALNTTHGSINLFDSSTGQIHRVVARGWLSEFSETPISPGQGIFGEVFSSGNAHISREFINDPLARPEVRDRLPAGWGGACVPISTTDQTLGVMLISIPSSRELDKNEIRLLHTLAEMTGNALHRMELHEETLHRAEEFASLYETNKTISAEHELNALLQTIVQSATDLLHASSGGMYLFDPSSNELVMKVSTHPSIPVGTRLALGEGLAGRVAQSRQPMRIDEYSTWEGRSPKYANVSIQAVLEVPILFAGELIGVLVVQETGASKRKFTNADERMLSLFAAQAAAAIRSARLLEETEQRLQHLQALNEIDRVITSSFDLRPILNAVVSHIVRQLDVDAADILLLNPPLQTMEYAAGIGFRTRAIERSNVRLGYGLAGSAASSHRTVHISNLPEAGDSFQRAALLSSENFIEYFGVPLISKGEVKGILEIFNRATLHPNREWLELLETMAGQTAIAIDNSQLFEKIQRSNMELALAYDATIEGWSRAMELRDEETEGHTQRVTEKAILLAQALGIEGDALLHLRRGALLHDIGKIGVPDIILLKNGPLTEEEQAIMHKHPVFAYQMLQHIPYLRSSIDIPYLHHEKWDGTGYPLGLKGEQIPIAARIFAVADVFDALTSDRPYRKAWSKNDALNYIREQSGKHFDPRIAETFIQLVEKEEN